MEDSLTIPGYTLTEKYLAFVSPLSLAHSLRSNENELAV